MRDYEKEDQDRLDYWIKKSEELEAKILKQNRQIFESDKNAESEMKWANKYHAEKLELQKKLAEATDKYDAFQRNTENYINRINNKLKSTEEKLKVAAHDLKTVACVANPEMAKASYWMKKTHKECADQLEMDADSALTTLKQISEG